MNTWANPQTWISLGGYCVGAIGLLLAIVSHFWNRRESRLEALGKVLQPTVRAVQHIHAANDQRRNCERLKTSFPDPESAPEAVLRVNQMVEDYSNSITAGQEQFRLAESEFAARSFRFPDKIARLLKGAQQNVSEFGRLVNEGMFERADFQFARVRDDLSQISAAGRGWRLADPFEGIRKLFARGRQPQSDSSEFELSETEMQGIMELVNKRATTQARNKFSVHAPRKLLENRQLASSNDVINELKDSVFVVVFQDGTSRMMSLVELMVFTYNLIVLQSQYIEVSQMMHAVPSAEREINVSFQFSIIDIMRPEMVKALLGKIDFSDVPTDDIEGQAQSS
jgi:hypothetical protein